MAKRLLVIGSGFHRHVLKGSCSPLCSWSDLLINIANYAKIFLPTHLLNHPTSAWEYLVLKYVENKPSLSAANAELALKKIAAHIIAFEEKTQAKHYSKSPLSNNLYRILIDEGIHLVNFNFDRLSYIKKATIEKLRNNKLIKNKKNEFGEARKSDLVLLHRRIKLGFLDYGINSDSVIWHPHGCVDMPDTIRMGLRDYGMMPSYYIKAFNYFKAWQRKVLDRESSNRNPITARDHIRLIKQLEIMDSNSSKLSFEPADNWVTRFMLLPVSLIGIGLSVDEFGLRWLLVQRARNLARIRSSASKVVLYGIQDVPQGVLCKSFIDWESAWEAALE